MAIPQFVAGNALTAAELNVMVNALEVGRAGTWTPTLTNIAIGTGGSAALTAAYRYAGGSLSVDILAILGTSGQSVTGNPAFSLPVGFTCDRVTTSMAASLGIGLICAGNYFEGVANHNTATTISILVKNASSTYVGRSSITNLIPATWVAGDAIFINGTIKGILT